MFDEAFRCRIDRKYRTKITTPLLCASIEAAWLKQISTNVHRLKIRPKYVAASWKGPVRQNE